MPTYAALIYEPEEALDPAAPEFQAQYAEYAAFDQEASEVLVGGQALQPTETATTIHVKGGKGGDLITTDGPFAETKEVLGGFYLIRANDLDEAVSWASKIPSTWHGGRVEVRPCIDFEQG